MAHIQKCSKNPVYVPKCNHTTCWDGYFRKNINKTMAARMLFLKIGTKAFQLTTGIKFTKQFIRFIQDLEQEKYGTISSVSE